MVFECKTNKLRRNFTKKTQHTPDEWSLFAEKYIKRLNKIEFKTLMSAYLVVFLYFKAHCFWICRKLPIRYWRFFGIPSGIQFMEHLHNWCRPDDDDGDVMVREFFYMIVWIIRIIVGNKFQWPNFERPALCSTSDAFFFSLQLLKDMNRSCRYKCRNIKQKSMPTKSFQNIQMSLKHKRSQLYSFAHELFIARSTKMNKKKEFNKTKRKTSLFLDFLL